jgi:histidyl-tRNA synthetase
MDYYNLTVFEFVTTRLGAQGTICAGGRYDYLTEQIGGKSTPAVGWALGVERVLELIKESGVQIPAAVLDGFAIVTDTTFGNFVVLVRTCGLQIQLNASADGAPASMKSQLKKADASGARFALIFGHDEISRGEVTVKALRDGVGTQTSYSLTTTAQWALSLLKKEPEHV